MLFLFQYEPEGNDRVFYLEDNYPAVQAITDISRRVTVTNGRKLLIHTNRSVPPVRALTAEQVITYLYPLRILESYVSCVMLRYLRVSV